MRGAVTGSALVHLVLMLVLMVMQARAPKLMIGPDVIQVSMVSMPAAAPSQPPPVTRATVKAPEIEPEKGTGVKITPPKPKKNPPPEAPHEPERPQPAMPKLDLPTAPIGRPGLSGDVAVDATNFEFSYYLLLLRNRVAANWNPPSGLPPGGQPIRAVVFFRVTRDGSVRDVRLESPSAAEFFDRSAVRAVAISDPMPPLPDGYTGNVLGVHFGFEYNGP